MLLSLLPTMAFAEETLPVATVAKIGDVEYTTLAEAITAAAGGKNKVITVLPGTIKIGPTETLTLASAGITLKGVRGENGEYLSNIIRDQIPSGNNMFIYVNAENITLEDLYIEYATTDDAWNQRNRPILTSAAADNFTMRNCYLKGPDKANMLLNPGDGADNGLIEGNTFVGGSSGIYIRSCSGTVIRNNTFINNGKCITFEPEKTTGFQNVQVTGNTFNIDRNGGTVTGGHRGNTGDYASTIGIKIFPEVNNTTNQGWGEGNVISENTFVNNTGNATYAAYAVIPRSGANDGYTNELIDRISDSFKTDNVLPNGALMAYKEVGTDRADTLFRPVFVAQIGATKYGTLSAAINKATDTDTIELLTNVTVASTISLTKDVTIDLNGHTVTGNDGTKGVRVFHVTGGDVNITGSGTLTVASGIGESSSVIRVGDNSGETREAKLTIGKDVEVKSDYSYGVTVFGSMTTETVDVNGKITTNVAPAVSGNGSVGYGNTNITVGQTATLKTTNDYAIYHPQSGTLTINGTVEGKGGIEAKAGDTTVAVGNSAKITATATETTHEKNNNGTSTSGYAIAVVENSAYAGGAKVGVNGGTVTGAMIVVADDEVDTEKKGSISITGGIYTSDVSAYVADGYACVDNTDYSTKTAYPYVVKPVQVEMTSKEDVQASGTEVTVGTGTDAKVIEIEASGDVNEVTTEVAAKTAEAIGEVLDNTNVTSFADTKIDEATEDLTTQTVPSGSYNIAKILELVRAEAAEKYGEGSSTATSNNTIGVTVAGATEAQTFTTEDVTTKITVDLTSTKVETTTETAGTQVVSATVSTMTFDVKPVATITVDKGNGQTEVIKAVIKNEDIKSPITFRLPVKDGWNEVRVSHNGIYKGTYIAQGAQGNRYVELASQKFSYWTVENNEFEDDEAVAKTGNRYYNNLAEALNDAANGDTVTVLKNCTLNKEVFITNKAITLDLNNCTVAVNTPSIGVPIHVGKKDSSTTAAGLTVKNGTINGTTATDGNVFGVYGMTTDNGAAKRTLTLDGVTLNANEYGVVVNNNSNHGYGAKITVENGSKINSGKSAVAINGKIQDTTGNVPEFVVNGSTLKVTKTNGVYSDEGNAIYAAGYAKWDIDNSTITGATGIYAKAGTFDIGGGTITAEGDAKAPVAYGNGGMSTGDGIIMDSKKGYAGNMTMNLNDVTVRSVNGNAVHEALTDKTTTSTQSIAITGGSFTAAVGKEAVVTSEAFDRADSTTLTVAGTPTGVTAQTDLGKFTSFRVDYGDGIDYSKTGTPPTSRWTQFTDSDTTNDTITDVVNFATMDETHQQLIANFDVTMGTVSYRTGTMTKFETIHSGDALDGVANDTAITFQIECGRTVTNTFTFTPHWESVSIPYTLTVKPISGETVTLTVGTDSANYVEYGVYASVPNGTSTMAIGSYDFELNYDTNYFELDTSAGSPCGFTPANGTLTELNTATAGTVNVAVALNTAVTPESVAEGAAPTYANTALLGTLKLKVKSNTTTTTGVLTTSITNTTGNKPVVTPKGYDKNNGTITTKDHTQYLISFKYVGATGDASAWVLSGKEPSMPTATPKIGWTDGSWSPTPATAATAPKTYTYTATHVKYTVTWNNETNPMTVTKTVYGTGGTETVTNGDTMYYEDTLTITVTGLADKTVIRNGDFKYKLGDANAVGVKRTGDTGFTYKVGPSVVNANVALSYTTSEYVTVTFSGGDAVELKNGDTTVTGDALKAIALKSATVADKLYASVDDFIKGNDGVKYVIPTQVPKENARLVPPEALTDYTKQSWKIANVTEPVANSTLNASPASYVFTADTILTADAVNTHKVTFSAGNGSFVTDPAQVIEYRVDAGTPIENILTFGSVANKTVYDNSEGTPKLVDEPKVVPVNGYKFDKWQPSATGNLAGDITITAQYAVAKYNISVSANATFKGLTGADATGKISMENNVTFKLMLKKNTRIDSVSYTVAPGANGTTYEGATNVSLTADANGVYTIPKANILGDVTVTVVTKDTVKVTVKSADTSKGTVGGTTAFVVDKDSNVSAWNYDALTTAAEPGYEVKKAENKIVFYTDADCTAKFEATQFTADTTLYVNFVDAKYVIELDELVKTNDMEGITAEITTYYVTHGTDAKFKLAKDANDPQIITSVTYSVEGGVQNVLLQPVNGYYTIPGERIIGKVTVTVKTLADEVFGSETATNKISALFIKRDATQGEDVEGSGAYMANVVQNGDMKILALVSEAFKANGYTTTNKFFQLANGTQLYWSDRYDAYVCWVSKDMKAADLDGFVKFDNTKTATAIANGGDINFDGSVDSADAGIVNDALHGTRQVPTSALQLFEMDVANTTNESGVNGATIDANDVTWILQKTVGKTVAKESNSLWAQPQ